MTDLEFIRKFQLKFNGGICVGQTVWLCAEKKLPPTLCSECHGLGHVVAQYNKSSIRAICPICFGKGEQILSIKKYEMQKVVIQEVVVRFNIENIDSLELMERDVVVSTSSDVAGDQPLETFVVDCDDIFFTYTDCLAYCETKKHDGSL